MQQLDSIILLPRIWIRTASAACATCACAVCACAAGACAVCSGAVCACACACAGAGAPGVDSGVVLGSVEEIDEAGLACCVVF